MLMLNKHAELSIKVYLLGALLIFSSSLIKANNPQFRLTGLQLSQQREETVMTIDKLFLAPDIVVDNIHYQCQGGIDIYPAHNCLEAKLAFDLQQNRLQLSGQVNYDMVEQTFKINAVDRDQTMVLRYDSAQQRQDIKLKNLPIKKWLPPLFTAVKENLSAKVSGDIGVALDKGMIESVKAIAITGLDYEHSDDLIALGVSGELDFSWDMQQQLMTAELNIINGEALIKQVYMNFSEFPLRLTLQVDMSNNQYVINWGLIHNTALMASGRVVLNDVFDMGAWQGRVVIKDSTLVNKHITNSVLEIYGFSKNQAAGEFTISATGEAARVDYITAEFNDFSFINEKRKLSITGLNGALDWQWHQISQPSSIRWQSLSLSGLPVAAATMNFNVSEDDFSLYGRHQFPIFDGALVIDRLTVNDFMAAFPAAVKMDAEIEPISLLPISQALAWPELAGQISGRLPGMVKSGNVIEFEGTLHLSVFDGSIRFNNLSMERLFGVAPVIAADVDIALLDLALLTKTYDFGLITGRLSGDIEQLRITNWKVDRMDATIYSVATKTAKQTISQRAIENISAIGGIKGAVSRTFLRFFDEFKYKKIMLSCKLHNSVCQIGGLDNQDGRFTIIEGGGLPKINIVGYAREIDWDVFISRLFNASFDS